MPTADDGCGGLTSFAVKNPPSSSRLTTGSQAPTPDPPDSPKLHPCTSCLPSQFSSCSFQNKWHPKEVGADVAHSLQTRHRIEAEPYQAAAGIGASEENKRGPGRMQRVGEEVTMDAWQGFCGYVSTELPFWTPELPPTLVVMIQHFGVK